MTDRDRFYELLETGINQRRVAAGQAPINRIREPNLEREAAERAIEARNQVGLDGATPIAHPGSEAQLLRLGWPMSVSVTELATWNYLWNDPIAAAVDTRTSDGSLFGLLNTEPHHTLLMNPVYTNWGTGIHREFRPEDDQTNPLFERWYFIIWLSTTPPLPPGPYSGFGTTYALPKSIRFEGSVKARQFAQDGTVLGNRIGNWPTKASSATAGRRAVIPGQPGAWLYIINGYFAGWWVPEGSIRAGNT